MGMPTVLVPLLLALDQTLKLWALEHLSPVPKPLLGFLIPIFFIRTGMGIDLSGLDGRLLLEVGQALLLMLLIRLLPAPFLLLGGFRLREAFLAALLLAYPFTLMIAGTEIARSAHLLDERAALVLLLAAALSSLLFPWAAKMLLRFLR